MTVPAWQDEAGILVITQHIALFFDGLLVIIIVNLSLLGVMRYQRERAGCPRDISPVDREQRTASREAEGMGLAGRHLARYRGKPFFLAPPMTGFSCQGVGRLLEAKTDPGVDSSSCKLVRD
ncbi:hypothetical protein DN604_04515 [Aeromonas caviae]|nr:hypothetical protein A6763_02590 [Aeromonas caviae]RWT79254.1 hypothetical protein DN604_04515 [Aeromonas caviae]